MEVTFEEARAHLGVETQRQWNDQAIERTTPALFGLFSLVTLWAHQGAENGDLRVRPDAWYQKEWPTFSDALAFVRRQLWETVSLPLPNNRTNASRSFCTSCAPSDVQKLLEDQAPPFVSYLIETLCYAN